MIPSRMMICPCGRQYNAAVLKKCPVCQMPANSVTTTGEASTAGKGDAPRSFASTVDDAHSGAFLSGRTGPNSRMLNSAISDARSQAGQLNTIAGVLSAIGITGGVIIGLLGLLLILNEEPLVGFLLVIAGAIGVLIWTFIGTLAQTFGKAIGAWMLWMDERG